MEESYYKPQYIRFILSKLLSDRTDNGNFNIIRNGEVLTIPSTDFQVDIIRTQESLIEDIKKTLDEFKETKGIDKIYIS